MKKHFYLAAAALLSMAATMNAQEVITEDMTLEDPASWDTHFSSNDITIAGATVTFANEAMNTTAFHRLKVDTVRLYNDAKIVMFDSPDTWYPSPEDPSIIEKGAEPDLYDADGNLMTETNYVYKVMGNATIDCDSKCVLGGKVMSEEGAESTLTLLVGDSTVINIDFAGFTGKLIFAYKNEKAEAAKVINFGATFPGTCPTCNVLWSNSSCKCWCAIPWNMQVPDGVLLNAGYGNSHIAFPGIEGHCHIYAPATLTLKPNSDWNYDFGEVTGGGLIWGGSYYTGRNLEMFPNGGITINAPIDYTCANVYPRHGGLWVNSQEPCFVNLEAGGAISVRSTDGYVGGNGIIAGSIACKDGVTSHIRPGAGFDLVGDLRVQRNISLGNNNAIDVDIAGNGNYDRVLVDGACYISGAYTRIWMQLDEDFYTSPKAGDYKVVHATEFVPNTVYFTDTTGTRFGDLDAATQSSIVDGLIAADTTGTFTVENRDSLLNSWKNLFEQFENPSKKDRDTIFFNITKIDTTGWEISQSIVWKTNTREDGTACDSLPEGYSWYPLDWNEKYDSATIVTMLDSLRADHFFSRGVISIYGPGYVEGVDPLNPESVQDIIADDPNKKVVSSNIYTEDGKVMSKYVKGTNIIRTVYSDGTVTTRKIYSEGE